MPQPIVETFDLTKRYGDVLAVSQLKMLVEKGDLFGFLGPNGAGKTTTILMLLGLTEPTSGTASVLGYNPTRNPAKIKRLTGYLPERLGFYDDMTALENLFLTTRLNGIPDREAGKRISELLGEVGLLDVADQKVGKFSRGMKQRLGIADLLVKEPELILLDEPTLGVDPEGVRKILDLIVDSNRKRKATVIISSHLLHQVQSICNKVGILVKGRMVAQGGIDNLGREVVGGMQKVEIVLARPDQAITDELSKVDGVAKVESSGNVITISCERDVRSELARRVYEMKGALVQIRAQDYALEEIYLRYFREA